jgi:hypothetical protein
MHGPGSEDPYCKKKKMIVLCIVFFDNYFTNYCYAYSFLHIKTYLLCIAINPSHFINIISSILASQLNYLSFHSIHSLYLILHISNYPFWLNACNSIHHYFASLSLHLFFMLLFLCISLYVLFLCDISLSLSLSVYMNFIIKDVDHMLWFFIGWKIRSD